MSNKAVECYAANRGEVRRRCSSPNGHGTFCRKLIF